MLSPRLLDNRELSGVLGGALRRSLVPDVPEVSRLPVSPSNGALAEVLTASSHLHDISERIVGLQTIGFRATMGHRY